MTEKINIIVSIGKKPLFLVLFFMFSSVFCFSQSITGRWERNIEGGKMIIIISSNGIFEAGVISSDGKERYFPPELKFEYFASNNILRFLVVGGTGRYAEPSRYEYHVEGNTLILIALNDSARVSNLQGRWAKSR